jgi:hypothetical protein
MDPRWLNLLLLLAVLVACSIAFALLLPIVWEHFKGARGGWGALARAICHDGETHRRDVA